MATAADTFDRTDHNPVSNPMSDGVATWVSGFDALAACQIISNQLRGTASSTYHGARVGTTSFSGDHFATCAVITLNSYLGPGVRSQGTADNRGYFLWTNASTSQLSFRKFTAAGSTASTEISLFTVTHGSGASGVLAVGDTITLSVTGTTFTISVNGTSEGTATDSDYSGGQPFIFIFDTGVAADNFSAGDNGPAAYKLNGATGVFVLTGNAATTDVARKTNAATGVFTLTGGAANLAVAHVTAGATGAFILTGGNATLTYQQAGMHDKGAGAGPTRSRKRRDPTIEQDRQRRQQAFDDALSGRTNAEAKPIPAGRAHGPTIQNPYAVTQAPSTLGENVLERVFVPQADQDEEDVQDVAFMLEHLGNLMDEEELEEIMVIVGNIPR